MTTFQLSLPCLSEHICLVLLFLNNHRRPGGYRVGLKIRDLDEIFIAVVVSARGVCAWSVCGSVCQDQDQPPVQRSAVDRL